MTQKNLLSLLLLFLTLTSFAQIKGTVTDEKGTPLDEIIERVNKNHESVGEIIDIQPSESESNDS